MKRVNRRRKKVDKDLSDNGFLSWGIEHIRPGITLDHDDDDYWDTHGGKPDMGDIGRWGDYLKDNATFWVKFRFDF